MPSQRPLRTRANARSTDQNAANIGKPSPLSPHRLAPEEQMRGKRQEADVGLGPAGESTSTDCI